MQDLNNANDTELIKNFIDGDESAFNRLVLKYQERIYWHARRMTGNHLDADEILQEVLLVIYNKLKTFEFKSSVYTWIYTITNTRSLNFIKRKKLRSILSLSDIQNYENTSENISADIDQKQKLEMIEKALQKLPVKQREVFIMRNYNEMSYEEIAEITGKSTGTLKANYFHALNKIKELVKDEE